MGPSNRKQSGNKYSYTDSENIKSDALCALTVCNITLWIFLICRVADVDPVAFISGIVWVLLSRQMELFVQNKRPTTYESAKVHTNKIV